MQEDVQKTFDAAVARYQGYLRADPGNFYLLVKLGELYQRCGKLDDAMACFEQCLASPMVGPVAQYQMGKVRLAQHRFQEAERDFRLLLEQPGGDPAVSHHLGVSLFHQRRWDEALASLDHARDLGFSNAENAAYRTRTLHQLGQLDCAIEACNAWLALDPCDSAYAYRALLLMAAGDMQQAHELALYVLQRAPTNPDAALVEWVSCLEAGADQESRNLLSLAAKPETARGWLTLALQLAQQRDAASALKAVPTALQNVPDAIDAMLTAGWVQLGLGNLLEATQAFHAALCRDDSLGEAHMGLAFALLLEQPAHKRSALFSTLKQLAGTAGDANQFAQFGTAAIVQHVRSRLREQLARSPYSECSVH